MSVSTHLLDEGTQARPALHVKVVRVLLDLLGLTTAAIGFFAPALRDLYDFPSVAAHVFVVGGLALLVLGLTVGTSLQRSGALVALALIGQACALQLIYAPAWDVYQHYLSWSQVTSTAALPFLLGLIAQTILVFWAGAATVRTLSSKIGRILSPFQLAAFSALLGFGAVVVARGPADLVWEILLTAWVGIVSAFNIALAARSLPFDMAGASALSESSLAALAGPRAAEWLNRHFVLLIAAWTVLLSALLAWLVFEAVPHIPDDISYLFQAKYLASGHWYLPAPPDAASFEVGQVAVDAGKWFGYGFPGWPAILSLGVIAHMPWLVNPLLSGVIVLLLHAVLTRSHNRGTAHAAVALLAVSPWFLFMSASFMTHTVTIVWTLLAILAVQKERESSRGYWAALAGLALGALFLTRPLEGLLVGAVVGMWVVGVAGKRFSVRGFIGFVVAGIALASLIFPYSRMLTGSPFIPPQQKWTDLAWYPGADRLGFGPNIGNVGWGHLDPLPGHGPLDVLINANRNFYMAGVELFGWVFGSLAFVYLAAASRGIKRQDFVFAGIALAIIAGHSLYWFSGGPDIGARYWYQAAVPFVVLTIAGLNTIDERLRRAHVPATNGLRLFVVLACLVAFPNTITWRAFGKYHRYRGMSADVRALAQQHSFGTSLVFVRAPDRVDYTSAFILNPPTLSDTGPIYVLELNAQQREKMMRAFPSRPVWVIGYPTAERTRMQVLAEPPGTR